MSTEAFAKIMAEGVEPVVPEPAREQAQESPEQSGAKIGEGHAMAMIRLGGHEITQALQAFPDSNIQPMEEPGVFGNPTPQIVTQEMGGLKEATQDMAGVRESAHDFSLQDILETPPQMTPPAQEQDREMGREM